MLSASARQGGAQRREFRLRFDIELEFVYHLAQNRTGIQYLYLGIYGCVLIEYRGGIEIAQRAGVALLDLQEIVDLICGSLGKRLVTTDSQRKQCDRHNQPAVFDQDTQQLGQIDIVVIEFGLRRVHVDGFRRAGH